MPKLDIVQHGESFEVVRADGLKRPLANGRRPYKNHEPGSGSLLSIGVDAVPAIKERTTNCRDIEQQLGYLPEVSTEADHK